MNDINTALCQRTEGEFKPRINVRDLFVSSMMCARIHSFLSLPMDDCK